MKCSKCGKEFGSGTNCQNCGIDRVTGLANYSGYDGHAGSNSYDSPNYGGQTSPKTTVCYACNEIIPLGATFCPVCGKKLLVTCPNCGHEYSSQYPVCSKCGTNRKEYNERKRREEEKKKAWEQSPKGKAEIERKRKEREKKEDRSMVLGQIIFWGGGIVLGFLLDGLIDKNWLDYKIPIFDFNIRLILLMGISFGASFLSAVAIDKIISEE
jgi:predicted RNA-binding Zn-ribbon protein involved in translation (DUF1610 family)